MWVSKCIGLINYSADTTCMRTLYVPWDAINAVAPTAFTVEDRQDAQLSSNDNFRSTKTELEGEAIVNKTC